MHQIPDLWNQLLAGLNYPKPRRAAVAHLHSIGWVIGETHVRNGICLPSDITAVALIDWSGAE